VIEDLVSTGKSSLKVVNVLRESGLEVIGMVSIFTYGFDVAQEAFKSAGLAYKSLTNYPALIGLASEKGQVKPEDETILLNWRKDPANWKPVS
jgi:orotate phosphoribosyltransferase